MATIPRQNLTLSNHGCMSRASGTRWGLFSKRRIAGAMNVASTLRTAARRSVIAGTVILLIGIALSRSIADPTPSPMAPSSAVRTYALRATNGGSESGEVQLLDAGSSGSTIEVSILRRLDSTDSKIQLVRGMCGTMNLRTVASLEEVPPVMALDSQGRDHVVWTAYRQWTYASKSGWKAFADYDLSIVAKDATGRIKWCGNLSRQNEMSPLPSAEQTLSPNASGGATLTVDELVSRRIEYDGAHVAVSGTVNDIDEHGSNDYEVFDLCGEAFEPSAPPGSLTSMVAHCVQVFTKGHPSLRQDQHLTVRGIFYSGHGGPRPVADKIEADDNSLQ